MLDIYNAKVAMERERMGKSSAREKRKKTKKSKRVKFMCKEREIAFKKQNFVGEQQKRRCAAISRNDQ